MDSSSSSSCQYDDDNHLYHIFGMDSSIKKNIISISNTKSGDDDSNGSPKEVLYLAGKYVVKYNIESKERNYALSSNCNFFGCMTVKDDFIYFGEVGINATILICNLSNLHVLGALKGGSDVGYSCLDISNDGRKLCSISRKPDHLLIVWDLETMDILMKTKACGQDIYHVAFSPFESTGSILTTSGKGHIKFWKMAETFTGLKLQGKFGKFGRTNICNIESFLYLKHTTGRILSGSDSGYLYLWQGGFLKCYFVQEDADLNDEVKKDEPCPIHKGGVNYLYHDKDNQNIITAGADGYMKWWQYSSFISAEPLDECESTRIALQPTRTLLIGNGLSNIKHIEPMGLNNFIAYDRSGKVCNVDLTEDESVLMWDFHGGNITCIKCSPNETLCVTCGDDGSIHCCDYHLQKRLSSKHFPLHCSKVAWCPKQIDKSERSFVVGFRNGSVKFLYLSQDKINIVQSFRPHKKEVTMITFKHCGSLLATGDETGIIFIFKCNNIQSPEKEIAVPICYVECNNAIFSNMKWHDEKATLWYIDTDGTQMETDFTETLRTWENITANEPAMTYRVEVTHRKVTKPMNQIASLASTNLKDIEYPIEKKTFNDIFTIAVDPNGILRILYSETDFRTNKLPTTATEDEQMSSSFLPQFIFYSGGTECEVCVPCVSSSSKKILDNFEDDNQVEDQPEDFTIEELLVKQFTEITHANATKKKNCIRRAINELRTEFISIRQLNNTLPLSARLPPCELLLNSFFQVMYSDMLQTEISKINAEHSEEMERIVAHYKKLEEIFVNDVETNLVVVCGLASKHKVQSFPMLKLDKNFIELQKSMSDNSETEEMGYRGHEIIKDTDENVDCVQKNTTSNGKGNEESNSLTEQGRNRKTMRMKRKQEIERKINECPTNEDDYFSKEETDEELGDWKLKSSKSYKVPLGKKINLTSKLKDMICCQEHIFNTRKSFNFKLLSLQSERDGLVKIIQSKGDRLKEIQRMANNNDENDLRMLFCEPTISVEILSDDGKSGSNQETYRLTSLFPQIKESSCLQDVSSKSFSELEKDEIEERKIILQFEIEKLSKEIDESISSFDESVYKLKRERFRILLDTKICEMNLTTMFRELGLLQQFEENDKILRDKLDGRNMEKIEIIKSIDRYKYILEEKNLKLDSMVENEKDLLNHFDDLVPITDSNRDRLHKIFMMKIKYYDDGDYISDEEGDDSDESFYESDDEIEVRPESCPTSTYDEILKLREKRVRQENERKLFQRQFDNVQRCHDQFCSKLRLSEKNLEELRAQIQIFDDKKLKALNEIKVIVPVKTNQMYVWEDDNNQIPATDAPFGEYVVFSNENLVKLVQRSRDIAQGINKEESIMKDLKVDLKNRTKENKHLEESIVHHRKRCEELQLLKFGQTIDIDHLDKLSEKSSSSKNHSSHLQIKKAAHDFEKEMNDIVTKNLQLKEELKKVTDESTRILTEIANFSKRQMTIEKDLKSNYGKEQNSDDKEKAIDLEILNLKKTKRNQIKEMERLQQDINKLRRKEGYIYGQLSH